MSLAAVDLNACRAWAISVAAGQPARVVLLDGERAELPLVIALDKRAPEVGRAGLSLCRKSPHQVCADFLPRLGTSCQWRHGRHELDASQAVALVFARLRKALAGVRGVALTVPGYLSQEQVHLLVKLAQGAGLTITAVLPASLASGLATYASHPWHEYGLVVDVDEHALSCAVLRPMDLELRLVGQRVMPSLGSKVWKERMLGRIAEYCIRVSRRDPREAPDADQMVHEQLDHVFDLACHGKPAPLRIHTEQWYQTLTWPPAEAVGALASLVQQVVAEVATAVRWAAQQRAGITVYVSAAAARLPGLVATLTGSCDRQATVAVLPLDAPARAAYQLALRIDQQELPSGFFDVAAPLPIPEKGEAPPLLPFPGSVNQAAREYR